MGTTHTFTIGEEHSAYAFSPDGGTIVDVSSTAVSGYNVAVSAFSATAMLEALWRSPLGRPLESKEPRDVALAHDARMVATHDADGLVLYSLDEKTGHLTKTCVTTS